MSKPEINNKQPVKAYNMAIINDDTAEITMYGDVVSKHPVDWWTGEKIDGNFIAVDDFLEDLEVIKDKANITININSGGGELYAGIAIYNRLKALSGNVTTINDGLAASAASIIFQAGNTRKMNAGSNLMIHGVSGFLFDYYNIQDLKSLIKQFEAHNKAALNIYAEKSGRPIDELKPLMDKETWLTGQAAVDAGLADEVIENAPVQMSMSADKSRLIINGFSIPTNRFNSIPQGIPVMNSVTQPLQADNLNTNNDIGGNTEMEIKNVEDLKNAFPEFVQQIENEAKTAGITEGVNQEKARLQAIEEIENKIDNKELIFNAKFGEKPMNANELAFEALKAQKEVGAAVLDNIDKDAQAAGTGNVQATPNNGNEGATPEDKAKEVMEAAINAFKTMNGNGGKK